MNQTGVHEVVRQTIPQQTAPIELGFVVSKIFETRAKCKEGIQLIENLEIAVTVETGTLAGRKARKMSLFLDGVKKPFISEYLTSGSGVLELGFSGLRFHYNFGDDNTGPYTYLTNAMELAA